MDRRFAADEWAGLTTVDKMRRCHRLAQEAMKLAQDAPSKLAEEYRQLAENWLKLGMELGADARRRDVP